MPIVGTAGHVDHGKSTLVEALTGRDPDRWAEEKRRGLTIDLGFAWTTLDDGREVGFVDVPGHERFIKNMLAGIDAIDVALLVVAADEGWMPQSEEHTAVLDLLGIDTAVVALTRIDLVDEETAQLAALEVEEHLAGTGLAGSPIVPIAAPAGTGVEELRRALTEAIGDKPPRDRGRPRLWVDRSFTVSGAGVVVTGTLLDGSVAVGDSLMLWPPGREVRVRGLQSHERERDAVPAGTRTAANLSGIERQQAPRGAMLGRAADWAPSDRLLVEVRTARSLLEDLESRGAYHFHLGSGAWPARLRILDEGAALLSLPAPVPVQFGDRFILRDVGRRAVVAGGRVLDPAPPRRPNPDFVERLRQAQDPPAAAAALLDARGLASAAELAAHSGGATAGRPIGDFVIASTRERELSQEAATRVGDFHRDNPLRPGMPMATLASQLGIEHEVAVAVVASSGELVDDGAVVRTIEFSGALSAADEAAWQKAQETLRSSGPAVPRIGDLGLGEDLFHSLVRSGRLIRVGSDYAFLPEQIDDIRTMLAELPESFTVAQFRDATGLTRRYAVPLLEWLDAAGITARDGDYRRLRG